MNASTIAGPTPGSWPATFSQLLVIKNQKEQKIETTGRLKSLYEDSQMEAIRTAYAKSYHVLKAFAEKIVRSPADAEDIVSNAFLKLHLSKKQIHGAVYIRKWLYTVVLNECIDNRRYHHSRYELAKTLIYLSPSMQHARTADHERTKISTLRKMLDLIEELPHQRKAVIQHFYFGKKTTHEIAHMMGLKRQTVLNHKNRAIASLREHLIDLEY